MARRSGKSQRFLTRQFQRSSAGSVREKGDHVKAVLAVISRVCTGSKTEKYAADDVASDVVASLWALGGFQWSLQEVEDFTKAEVRKMLFRIKLSRTKPASEYAYDDGSVAEKIYGVSKDDPFISACASEAMRMLSHLPARQAEALSILGGGGSPIDVALDMHIKPHDAIYLIKEARSNIARVATDADL